MRNLIALALLSGFCFLQSMEKEDNNSQPYEKRDEIGRLSRKSDSDFTNMVGHSDPAVGSFYIGGFSNEQPIILRRVPRVSVDNGALDYFRTSVEAVRAGENAPGRLDLMRLVYLREMFTGSNSAFRDLRLKTKRFFDVDNINLTMPLFIRPEVEFREEGKRLFANLGGKTCEWSTRAPLTNINADGIDPLYRQFYVYTTALQFAAMSADWDAMKLLLAMGADPEVTSEDLKLTPLELLFALVDWEQEQIGEQQGSSREVINQRKKAARGFVRQEWQNLIAEAQQLRHQLDKTNNTTTNFTAYCGPVPVMGAIAAMSWMVLFYLLMSRGSI